MKTKGMKHKGSTKVNAGPWNGGLKISGKKADRFVKNNCVSPADLLSRRQDFLNTIIPPEE